MEGKLPTFFRRLFRIGRREDPLLERYLRRNREALDRQRRKSGESGVNDPPVEELPEKSAAPKASDGVEEETQEQLEKPASELPDSNQGNLPLGN